MANGNGFNGWVTKLAGGLALIAIVAAAKGYSDDGIRDRRLDTIEDDVDRHEIENREQHDAILNTNNEIKGIHTQLVLIADSIEKIARAR